MRFWADVCAYVRKKAYFCTNLFFVRHSKFVLAVYIAISGNMGSGKTTLTRMLAKHYGWTPRFETVEQNPYLDDFYKDMARWDFNVEVFFLKERFKDLLAINHSTETIVQDRSIYEGVYVFTANSYAMGYLDDRDFECFMELFESMLMVAHNPDLMIYLRCGVGHLVKNIQKRGRDYEQNTPIEYLTGLNERYEDFVMNRYKGKKLIVDVERLDYEHRPEDFKEIIDAIDAELFGLFAQK